MAVYKRTYKPYTGRLTEAGRRFLVIPRYAFHGMFDSRPVLAFYVLCFLPLLVSAATIYLSHNPAAQALLSMDGRDLFKIDRFFFSRLFLFQSVLSFMLTTWVGTGLISADLSNDALPLYLCRPFSRAEYVLGKLSVIAILISMITWVPGLMLFALQANMAGWDWFVSNYWMAGSIVLGSWIWITLVALLVLAISSWVKWRVAATAMMLGVFFVPPGVGEAFNEVLRTNWGKVLNLGYLAGQMWDGLFGVVNPVPRTFNREYVASPQFENLPAWSAWIVFALVAGACLWILNRRLQAKEVVRG